MSAVTKVCCINCIRNYVTAVICSDKSFPVMLQHYQLHECESALRELDSCLLIVFKAEHSTDIQPGDFHTCIL